MSECEGLSIFVFFFFSRIFRAFGVRLSLALAARLSEEDCHRQSSCLGSNPFDYFNDFSKDFAVK